ncbi:hypothetical protein [Hymenobacter sp. DG25B]|uniref:hypothetical protein n=1 Tax=Hymenobacter sp. DG25B TaxID=1385664 RepID=UPI0012E0822B|nr:hypothetical protein [Hymenobacter sp. DG25B]
MEINKTDLKFLTPFLLYLIFGIYNSHIYNYIDNQKTLRLTFDWFTAPSIILGFIYSYYSIFQRGAQQALWRKAAGLLALTSIFTLLFLTSSQGYVILWNANFGNQDKIILHGKVSKLDYPKNKKPLNSHAVFIKISNTNKIINLDVPSNNYVVGQIFEKKMIKGSLGILYAR